MSESFEVNVGGAAAVEAPPAPTETPAAAPAPDAPAETPAASAPRSITLLADEADEGGWNDVYTQLGRPETAEAYELNAALEGVGMDPMDEAFLGNMSQVMHRAGLSTKQAVALTRACNEQFQAMIASQQELFNQSLAEAREMFPPQTIEKAVRALKAAGLDEAARRDIERALGPKRAIEIFSAAAGVLEDKMPAEAGGGSFSGSPAAAQARVDQLMNDTGFVERYMRGDAAAIQQIEELSKKAVGR